MCKPNTPTTRHVVVAGAGPAGLLLTLLLLQRNFDQAAVQYKVTLVESRSDLGQLNDTELQAFRSWMIGLAGHGLHALRKIPTLYEQVTNVGVRLLSASLWLGQKELSFSAGAQGVEGYIVDRNYIVAALARFMEEKHGKNALLERKYDTQLLYVDAANQRILTRGSDGLDAYVDYDVLLGCDGLRSVVRDALAKRHFDFACDTRDIFQTFKTVHVARPKSVDAASMHLLPNIMPDMTGIALPETGGMLNVGAGVARHKFDDLANEMKSDDPAVVAKYVKENFKAFELEDYDDFAKQWVASRWQRTGQVHCNFYHSVPLKLAILGDAAHATSPSVGMGMNTALRDAQVFYELLDECDDDIDKVLPRFSQERVKEGNALTDLSLNLYCFDARQQAMASLHLAVRGILAKFLPWVQEHPQALLGRPGYSLSELYTTAVELGILTKHRNINDKLRREHFERETGMITRKPKSSSRSMIMIGLICVAAVVAALYFRNMSSGEKFMLVDTWRDSSMHHIIFD